jgi:hypothetical protein
LAWKNNGIATGSPPSGSQSAFQRNRFAFIRQALMDTTSIISTAQATVLLSRGPQTLSANAGIVHRDINLDAVGCASAAGAGTGARMTCGR